MFTLLLGIIFFFLLNKLICITIAMMKSNWRVFWAGSYSKGTKTHGQFVGGRLVILILGDSQFTNSAMGFNAAAFIADTRVEFYCNISRAIT